MQRKFLVSYRRFRATYPSQLQRPSSPRRNRQVLR